MPTIREISDILGVTEEPVTFGEYVYTARRTPGIDPPRWQVFVAHQGTPAGYLEAFWSPGEFEAWRLRVFDGNSRLLGQAHIEDGREDLASAGTYHNALSWLREALAGRI